MTYVYDISERFTASQALSTDGWNDTTDKWIALTFNSDLYARRCAASTDTPLAPDTIFRPNDTGFSFTIPSGTPRITLTVTSRSVTSNREVGLATGTTRTIGLGVNQVPGQNLYINDNGSIVSETGASAPTADNYRTIMFDFDLVAGTADLIFDPAGANTLLLDDVALSIPAATLEGTNSLYISSASRFAGPASITLDVIPEPSAISLGGLGMVALLLRRRRR